MKKPDTGQLLRLSLLMCLFVGAMTTGGASVRLMAQGGERGVQEGRLRPPPGLSCDRNHTTSFTGRIMAYSRTSRHIFIRVRTDEQTTEQFTIRLGRSEEASSKFLFQGEAFKPEDWKKIERGRGLLKPKMRATIWACRDDKDDFRAELIDWRPGETDSSFVL
jgi:hypothetical protein